MSKKNGKNFAERVKAALQPKPRIRPVAVIALTVVYDAQKGTAGVTFTSPQSGVLDITDLYRAVEAARRHVMQLEQQSLMQQAAAQSVQSGAVGQLAAAVVVPAAAQDGQEKAEGGRQ